MTLILLHQCIYLRSNILLQASWHSPGGKSEVDAGVFTQDALPSSSFNNRTLGRFHIHYKLHYYSYSTFMLARLASSLFIVGV